MEFKIIKDTNEEFVLRLDAGKLRVNYIISTVLLVVPSVMVIAAVVFAMKDRSAGELEIAIFISIIGFGIFGYIDGILISVNLKQIRFVAIDVVNRALKVKSLLPRSSSTYPLDDIEHFAIHVDDKPREIMEQYQPMRLELFLRSGEKTLVFESMQKFQETLEAAVHAIEAAMHKEIPYKAAQP